MLQLNKQCEVYTIDIKIYTQGDYIMSEKKQMNEVTYLRLKNQFLEQFCTVEPIAKDFISAHVVADMYCDDTEDGFVKYHTLGISTEYLDNGWYEFSFATPKRLEYSAEKAILEDISNITCQLIEREYDDSFYEIETGIVFPASRNTKNTLGYDGFILEIHDMGFTALTGETLYILLLVPVYENEMKFIAENGYDLFFEKYEELVPDEEQILVGVKRKPIEF